MITPQFLRFLLVGVVNTVFGYTLFALLTWFGLNYPLAVGITTLGSVAFNFQSIGNIVFRSAELSRLARFAGVYVVIYCLNLLGIAGLLKLGLSVYIATAILIFPLALLAYLLQRKFVFTKNTRP